jgi:ABC-type transport system involved in multi-copper enzyme maturation permease subunit
MFLGLLLITFVLALSVSAAVARMFTDPLDRILKRIIADEISDAWLKYMRFAILVVGVSSGVRIYELEKYITPATFVKDSQAVQLTFDRWVLEIYRTIIETLQGIAWMLLVFFVFALIAYVIVRLAEMRKKIEHDSPAP